VAFVFIDRPNVLYVGFVSCATNLNAETTSRRCGQLGFERSLQNGSGTLLPVDGDGRSSNMKSCMAQ
jgi:hypothetical protein